MYMFKQQFVSKDKYPIKCPYPMKVSYITVHDTGNSGPAVNEIKYMVTNNHQVSFHLAVDEAEVIQGLPLNRNSWACGDGGEGTGNRQSINVEICRPTHVNTSLYKRAEENAVYVVARLLYENQLSIEKLKKHQDWSGKTCPQVLLNEGRWDEFKGRVQTVLKGIVDGKIIATLTSGITEVGKANLQYFVGDQVKVLESAHTYATGEKMKDWVKGSIYQVIGVKENQVLLSKINSWVNMNDLEKVTDENSFLVEIICNELNVRQQADFKSKVVGKVKRGEVYTIIQIENGLGKLKSGIGYISMNPKYIKRE
ncbi:N-acetylmuramoyl-L-alanine amidase [Turicibacter sanguinis]|nr:N-acetylmuramoyl-L-alanine amidase [Turicibacter sanguinis]MTN83164.1 N-acetylmuramoyl-L-alanine amidase [Turicibacter sanguinis]MTN88116.1 N-acetylmuramoyl-L-alanine amidase [Turicibacter sanguinis]MTN90971.1 N-acetylmuramoyl-L-alanine amidase [Turicibacter sanguinis]MTN93606.1 N-acetylmuramoyl-L-alanine amidase [Turicibacter sanguinis]